MNKKKMAALLTVGLGVTACLGAAASARAEEPPKISYKVLLPEDAESSGRKYPSVYLMPSNGHQNDLYGEEQLAALLAKLTEEQSRIPMAIIVPEFDEGTDYTVLIQDLVQEVESKYPVIPEARYRGILGADLGGAMALDMALVEKSDLFYAAGSVMGEFLDKTILDAANALDKEPESDYSFLQNHYFYLEAPNGSADSTAEGSTTEIGASLEKKTNPYYQYGGMYYLYSTPDISMVEYAVNDGEEGTDYALEALERALNRFSHCYADGLVTGSFTLSPQVVSAEETQSEARAAVTLAEDAGKFTTGSEALTLTLSMTDPETQEILYTEEQPVEAIAAGEQKEIAFTLPMDKKAAGVNTQVQLALDYMGLHRVLDTKSLVSIQPDGETEEARQIDLMGNWYFKAYKEYTEGDTSVADLDQVSNIVPEEYEQWGVVQPCLGWWDNDFDASLMGQGNYAGYAWYVRTFEVPDNFPTGTLTLAAGYFDEANEVYVNGKLVGSTGMDYSIVDGIGVYDGSNPWDTNCVYSFDSSLLNYGETNTIAIRMCNSSGGGGWYQGPVGIYTESSYKALQGEGSSRLLEKEYVSKALGGDTETYRIYLPEGYDEEGNDKQYPVLYLLHGINSQSKTFEIDKVDHYLDQAIAEGRIPELIVVMPDDPTKESFWKDSYSDMVTEDLIAEVDSQYRTIADAKSRFVAGCSMGGGGACSMGLHHPELFSGIISFYGALDYVDAMQVAADMDAETLGGYKIYMTCGNQDMYNFYDSQEQMSRLLTEKGIAHYHQVNNGTHSSEYYLPRFIDAIAYVTQE